MLVSNSTSSDSVPIFQSPKPAISFSEVHGISEIPNNGFNAWLSFSNAQQSFQAQPSRQESVPIISSLTVDILKTFQQVDPSNYTYEPSQNPKRVLTRPSKAVKNNGWDNESSDLIVSVGMQIGSDEGKRYSVLDNLGHGTFGQVFRCRRINSNDDFPPVAIKIIKNEPNYFTQSLMEITILDMIADRAASGSAPGSKFITKLLDTFIYRNHLCLVFELLNMNLYELLKQNSHRGLDHRLIQQFLSQLLEGMCLLKEMRIVHYDLKPENILLRTSDASDVKIIDFGSGCHENQPVYSYIQSRFYRAPEVLFGNVYTSAIDMWSFGCIAMELFIGVPVFAGNSNYDQVKRIVECLGMPTVSAIQAGKDAGRYFSRVQREDSTCKFFLKSRDTYERETGIQIAESKRYFSGISLDEIISLYPVRKKVPSECEKERLSRLSFLDFVKGCLRIDPRERWTPQQAKRHPYITGKEFTGPFDPNAIAYDLTVLPIAVASPAARLSRPRAMTIGGTKPEVSIPAQLERVARAAGGSMQAARPAVGVRQNLQQPQHSDEEPRQADLFRPPVDSSVSMRRNSLFTSSQERRSTSSRYLQFAQHLHHQLPSTDSSTAIDAAFANKRTLDGYSSARRESIPSNHHIERASSTSTSSTANAVIGDGHTLSSVVEEDDDSTLQETFDRFNFRRGSNSNSSTPGKRRSS